MITIDLLTVASQTITTTTRWLFNAAQVAALFADLNISAVGDATANLQWLLERQGDDLQWYAVTQSAGLSTPTPQSFDVGPGLQVPRLPAAAMRLSAVVTGGTTPSFTITANIKGR